ncbi:MAG: 3-phosphoserine/phosphohydroxythreonine transaminase, partial [Myxococcota bacterium]|nr:3-phosphoserine/phosphohydroxythreonine transaminase [Myxococcota bacterium]
APNHGSALLVSDMSSDICSRPLDVSDHDVIYAGAQKNLGPSGVTVVVIRDDLIETGRDDIPTLLQYRTQASKDSLFNTPNSFGIYFLRLYLEHVKKQGGLDAVQKLNHRKQELVYRAIDDSDGYYRGTVELGSRSWMNATIRLRDEALEKQFIAEGAENGLVGLKGHRSVGGIRVSMYNAMSLEGIQALVAFMADFKGRNG